MLRCVGVGVGICWRGGCYYSGLREAIEMDSAAVVVDAVVVDVGGAGGAGGAGGVAVAL